MKPAAARAWTPKPSDGAPVPSARPVSAQAQPKVAASTQNQQASADRQWPQSAREKPSAKQVDVSVSRPHSAREHEEQVRVRDAKFIYPKKVLHVSAQKFKAGTLTLR